MNRARQKHHDENPNKTIIDPSLFFFFLTLVQSFPKLLKTNKRSKRRNKKAKGCFVLFLFSVAYKFEELMRIFLWCGLEFLV